MPLKEVVWTSKAFKGINSIYQRIAKDSETAAKNAVVSILNREERLQFHPESGTIESALKLKREYRYLVESHYKIIYR